MNIQELIHELGIMFNAYMLLVGRSPATQI